MIESHFRKKGQAAYHGGVQFRGILEVTDQNHFIETYYAGIGSTKAFGFGLLLLAPIEM
jgi:CRISPR system Cascade subunit CasE